MRILFVCHGNICRSPMAEYIMKELVREAGRQNDFYIASAATSTEEIGNSVYPPVQRLLAARGIDCREKRAVQVCATDYARYDHIVCMDRNNLRNIRRLFPADPQKKISLLMDWTDTPHDVADPWYTRDFSAAEQDVEVGCAALLAQLSR
ncbi:MAG: low molecular weight phosphotyrosine protein phosphatase [Clostridia bacterium]|nr:low molecular weight phosphotyrosine protein phosphatase [Clostridia bacterium]